MFLCIKTFNKDITMAVRFYDKKAPHFEFSNYYGSHIDKKYKLEISEVSWPTTEHYYQASKYRNKE